MPDLDRQAVQALRRIADTMTPPRGAWRSLVSALVWGTRGPEFKSRRPDWTKALLTQGFHSGISPMALPRSLDQDEISLSRSPCCKAHRCNRELTLGGAGLSCRKQKERRASGVLGCRSPEGFPGSPELSGSPLERRGGTPTPPPALARRCRRRTTASAAAAAAGRTSCRLSAVRRYDFMRCATSYRVTDVRCPGVSPAGDRVQHLVAALL